MAYLFVLTQLYLPFKWFRSFHVNTVETCYDYLTTIIPFFHFKTLHITHIQTPLQLLKITTLSKMPISLLGKTMKEHDIHIINEMMAFYIKNITITVV